MGYEEAERSYNSTNSSSNSKPIGRELLNYMQIDSELLTTMYWSWLWTSIWESARVVQNTPLLVVPSQPVANNNAESTYIYLSKVPPVISKFYWELLELWGRKLGLEEEDHVLAAMDFCTNYGWI